MIEYVAPYNIDDRVLTRGAALLSAGALLAFPSDTSWCVACSFGSKEGIKRLRRLSGEREERYFTLLCADISQFGEFCSLDNTRFRLIKRLTPGPYVFILKTLSGTGKALTLSRPELGVRIPGHPIPLAVIRSLGAPLYSITAKRSMIAGGEAEEPGEPGEELPPIPEAELFESGWELEAIPGLDLIMDGGEEQARTFSTILDLTGGEARPVRRGAGPWPA
ncbi:MAG: Sua5/YciO/YrdC/YwlC family protein [Spirochaetaceae bacterium]|jgi:tRNA threonylcarbamoyl adenosine modification protein (Sua5/YciO/YrdC/YwlC family)|nr:Sua5/YciO/YrdC/YwlC family protein [Spirochaetaceae bacterium]